jgi:DNA-directed RNA polymerase specialized sigma24 family protein
VVLDSHEKERQPALDRRWVIDWSGDWANTAIRHPPEVRQHRADAGDRRNQVARREKPVEQEIQVTDASGNRRRIKPSAARVTAALYFLHPAPARRTPRRYDRCFSPESMASGNPEWSGGSRFPATRHSIIERIRVGDTDVRRQAFGDLVEGYWKPVYTHLRLTWHLDPDDAQDATQGFFAEAYEKGWLERFEAAKARFRTFVRVCADRFVQNRRQAASRAKRGGGVQFVALDFEGAERDALARMAAPGLDPDALFHQEFVRALFERAVRSVRQEFEAAGKSAFASLFERYDVAPGEGDSYATLAVEFGLTATQVTNALALARRRFREHALDALRAVCATDDEFRRDARDLFGVEVE